MMSTRYFLRALVCVWTVPRTSKAFAVGRLGLESYRPTMVDLATSGPHTSRLFSSGSDQEIPSMRAADIKRELESYGISTKSFFEKSELVEALQDARARGLEPKATSTVNADTSTDTSSSSHSEEVDNMPREERIKEEMEKCRAMKAGELKNELQEMGVSTASFFEKSEFVKALAEARVDDIDTQTQEGYAEYADVEVITDDEAGPRQTQQEQPQDGAGSGNPFGGQAGGNPFGGGMGGMGGIGDMFNSMGGGSGGMGGMADMFKNMGGGAGATNPFGGMGGMGNNMGMAQELMKNPKVMELVMKAQQNPRIQRAMQECMSNPAAFAKYQNDPEIAELMNELRKVM